MPVLLLRYISPLRCSQLRNECCLPAIVYSYRVSIGRRSLSDIYLITSTNTSLMSFEGDIWWPLSAQSWHRFVVLCRYFARNLNDLSFLFYWFFFPFFFPASNHALTWCSLRWYTKPLEGWRRKGDVEHEAVITSARPKRGMCQPQFSWQVR